MVDMNQADLNDIREHVQTLPTVGLREMKADSKYLEFTRVIMLMFKIFGLRPNGTDNMSRFDVAVGLLQWINSNLDDVYNCTDANFGSTVVTVGTEDSKTLDYWLENYFDYTYAELIARLTMTGQEMLTGNSWLAYDAAATSDIPIRRSDKVILQVWKGHVTRKQTAKRYSRVAYDHVRPLILEFLFLDASITLALWLKGIGKFWAKLYNYEEKELLQFFAHNPDSWLYYLINNAQLNSHDWDFSLPDMTDFRVTDDLKYLFRTQIDKRAWKIAKIVMAEVNVMLRKVLPVKFDVYFGRPIDEYENCTATDRDNGFLDMSIPAYAEALSPGSASFACLMRWEEVARDINDNIAFLNEIKQVNYSAIEMITTTQKEMFSDYSAEKIGELNLNILRKLIGFNDVNAAGTEYHTHAKIMLTDDAEGDITYNSKVINLPLSVDYDLAVPLLLDSNTEGMTLDDAIRVLHMLQLWSPNEAHDALGGYLYDYHQLDSLNDTNMGLVMYEINVYYDKKDEITYVNLNQITGSATDPYENPTLQSIWYHEAQNQSHGATQDAIMYSDGSTNDLNTNMIQRCFQTGFDNILSTDIEVSRLPSGGFTPDHLHAGAPDVIVRNAGGFKTIEIPLSYLNVWPFVLSFIEGTFLTESTETIKKPDEEKKEVSPDAEKIEEVEELEVVTE